MKADYELRTDTNHHSASLPPTSLIVCSRNRPHLLHEAVSSILSGGELPAELIIVDQSTAPHPALAALTRERACEVRYLWTDSVGLCRAMNEGIEAARHELLAFTHDDVAVAPNWFGTLMRTLLSHGENTVVTGQVKPTDFEQPGSFATSVNPDPVAKVYRGRLDKDVLYPLNMSLRRSLIDRIGGFDVRLGPGTPFPASEDSDFGFRLLELGHSIVYEPAAIVYHRSWRSNSDYLPLRWNYGVGRGGFYAKHVSLRDRHILGRLQSDIRNHLLAAALRLRQDRRRAFGDVALAVGIVWGALKWAFKHRRPRLVRR